MKSLWIMLALSFLLGANTAAHAEVAIFNRSSNLVLEGYQPDVREDGCRTQLGRDQGAEHQRWRVEPAGTPGLYRILNVEGDLSLDAHLFDVRRNNCRIQLWRYHGGQNQLWRIDSLGGDIYRIRSEASGKVLAADLATAHREGCRLQLWDDLNLPNQQWRIPGLFEDSSGRASDAERSDDDDQ
jgi:hypothetical protein